MSGTQSLNTLRSALDIAIANEDSDVDKILAGTTGFGKVKLSDAATTSSTYLDITGASTMTADDIMHQTLVNGAGVTTFTKAGFVRIAVVDSAGNITDGDYYVQFGTLS